MLDAAGAPGRRAVGGPDGGGHSGCASPCGCNQCRYRRRGARGLERAARHLARQGGALGGRQGRRGGRRRPPHRRWAHRLRRAAVRPASGPSTARCGTRRTTTRCTARRSYLTVNRYVSGRLRRWSASCWVTQVHGDRRQLHVRRRERGPGEGSRDPPHRHRHRDRQRLPGRRPDGVSHAAHLERADDGGRALGHGVPARRHHARRRRRAGDRQRRVAGRHRASRTPAACSASRRSCRRATTA